MTNNLTEAASRHAIYTNRFAGHLANLFDPYSERLKRELRLIMLDAPETTQNMRRINQIVKEFRGISLALYGDYNEEQVLTELSDFAAAEGEFAVTGLKTVVKSASVEITAPTSAQLWAAVNSTPLVMPGSVNMLAPFILEMEAIQIKKVSDLIKVGFMTGRTNVQIAKDIAGKNGYLDKQNKRNIKTMVRTATNHVSNIARQRAYDENDDIITGYKIVATLDGRTSNVCFTGSTTVNPVSDIERLYRSNYSGSIITVNLSTGEKIEGTPNHPILTQHGWTKLGEIDPSEHVIYSARPNSGAISVIKDIYMPTTFTKLYDSISKSSAFDVVVKSTSTADFYGDGVGMDGKVNIHSVKRHLGCDIEPSTNKLVVDNGFGFIKPSSYLSSLCGTTNAFFCRFESIKASKVCTRIIKSFIKAAFGKPELSLNLARTKAFVKHVNSILLCKLGFNVDLAPTPVLHESDLLKEASNCGSAGFVLSGDLAGANTFAVKPCYIVSVSSEFKSCHVYTLSNSQGYYTSGGIIVKNCKGYDGTVVKNGDEFKPMPPFHPNCRTTTRPFLDERFTIDDEPGTKATADTRVNANKSYYQWLKDQGNTGKHGRDFVVDVLGKKRADLFLDGGLSIDKFKQLTMDELFRPLPLSELRKKESLQMAFDKVG